MESWIFPNWWANVTGGRVPSGQGEFQFCQILGADACKAALESHWDSWVTESDIATLASAGVTHVRIPIGYWIAGAPYLLPTEPYQTGGWPYLIRCLGWLKQYGVQAVIDLHGAPGSQNGHDNSGSSGAINWTQPANIQRTVDVLTYLAANLTAVNAQPETAGVVAGIEVLNEPWTTNVGGPITMDVLKAFVQQAVDGIRGAGFTGDIWFPDGWDITWSGWSGFLAPPSYQNIFVDTHLYHCFGGYDQFTNWQQINSTCKVDLPRLANMNQVDWPIVGEYSLCMPNAPTFPYSIDDTMMFRAYAEAQMQAYGSVGAQGATKGGFFWNFKTESPSEWSYLDGLKYGYIPNATIPKPGSAFDCLSI